MVLVVTAVYGQRAGALPLLVARSHALVYLFVVLVQRYGTYTRSSCSVALKSCSCALVGVVGTTHSVMVSILVHSSYG